MSSIKRIFIIGHSGAGKGVLAQAVAKSLGWKFINADVLGCAAHIGRTVSEVVGTEGELITPLNSFKEHATRLAIAQRRLSKKKKYSQNWKKQQEKIRAIHSKIADTRKDYLHKASTRLSKNHAMIVIEDLQVSNMSRSANGTIENPGRNVRAKSGLNKAILDQGWYEFRQQLDYKLGWQRGVLLTVSPQYTSQKCSVCHHISKANRLSQSDFKCEVCGFFCHADINASHNILAAGHAVLACGASA